MTAKNPDKTPSQTTLKNASKQTKKTPFLTKALRLGLPLTALGLVIIAFKASDYLHEHPKQQLQNLYHQIGALQEQNKSIAAELAKEKERTSQLDNELSTLDKHFQSALKERLYEANDWLLLKVRYHLELAKINAQWGDDPQTTSVLLHQADFLLANIPDQRALPIRQSIAKEVAECQTIVPLDISSLLNELDSALILVAKIPLKSTMEFNGPNNPASAKTMPKTTAFNDQLNKSLKQLESLVVIRHHNEDIHPLPSQAYEAMLREEIRLNIQEAQWALLHRNEAVYQWSLSQALQHIHGTFEASASTTTSLIRQLQHLQQMNLALKKPMVGHSLPLLNEWIESKNVPTPKLDGDHSS